MLYLLTLPDPINPGVSYLLVHCRSNSDCTRRCFVFDSESSKFIKCLDTRRSVKHIDFKRPNLIIVIYYDKSEDELKAIDGPDFNPSTIPKKCRIFGSVHEILDPEWWLKGTDLFPSEDLKWPGHLEFSDRQATPLFITKGCN